MNDQEKTIRPATLSDVPAAAATLTAAFATYPWTRWSIPAQDYEARLEQLQAIYLSHAIQHGIVLVTSDLTGVAAMLPPNTPEPLEPVQAQIADLMGDRLSAVMEVELPQRPANSWDFATIGVHPNHAGKGLGGALIRQALHRAISSGNPRVSLETSAESNVALYEKHGFRVTHETHIEGGPDVYSMVTAL